MLELFRGQIWFPIQTSRHPSHGFFLGLTRVPWVLSPKSMMSFPYTALFNSCTTHSLQRKNSLQYLRMNMSWLCRSKFSHSVAVPALASIHARQSPDLREKSDIMEKLGKWQDHAIPEGRKWRAILLTYVMQKTYCQSNNNWRQRCEYNIPHCYWNCYTRRLQEWLLPRWSHDCPGSHIQIGPEQNSQRFTSSSQGENDDSRIAVLEPFPYHSTHWSDRRMFPVAIFIRAATCRERRVIPDTRCMEQNRGIL